MSFWTPESGGAASSPLTTKGDVWGYSTTDARIPIGSDGQVLTADSAQTLGLKWAASSAVTETSFSPTFTAATTNPTLGTGGSITGFYVQDGDLIVASVAIHFGTSGVNAGSGQYFVGNLPQGSASYANFQGVNYADLRDNSAGAFRGGSIFWNNTSRVQVGMAISNSTSVVSHNAPWTWAASDQLFLTLVYFAV